MPSTQRFEWKAEDIIGKGAFGTVYKGKAKKKNTDVAIKQFHGTPDIHIKREALTLKLAQTHKNIVKFIDFEQKYLITELCAESLDKLLKRNKNGLPFDELMVFTAHLFAGLKRLRKFNIIHRDLKPGNMLVSRVNDKNVYKISDFGAARILQDHEAYTSLYGTAEYTHPDILAKFYEYMSGIVPKTKYFMCKHEIWPIAVTIFECATGHLPFEPKLGGRNIKLQYRMIMEKKPDHIYATETDSGTIEWHSHLPGTCQMDETVKAALETLLIGMLKFSDEMSFEEFFDEADKFQKVYKSKQQKVRRIRKVNKRRVLNYRSVQ